MPLFTSVWNLRIQNSLNLFLRLLSKDELIHRKVTSSRLSRLVAHPSIFRMFMKGKFDALAKSFQN